MGLVADAIGRYIAENREIREGEQPYWYPSNLGGCDRQAILKRSGLKGIPFDERTLRVFWMGDEVHRGLQKAVEQGLPEGYSVVGHELRVRDDEYQVSGRLDTLISCPDGELEVVDYKSIRSDGFKPDLPKKEHLLQVGIYGAFPAETAEGQLVRLPSRGRIVYWSKDDAKILEYTFPITEVLRDEVKARLVALTEDFLIYKETGALPAPIPLIPVLENGEPQFYVRGPKKGLQKLKMDWRVNYCPYKGSGKCCAETYDLN